MKNLLASTVVSVCLFAAHSASALLAGPYTTDPYTLHLWHLDESSTPCSDFGSAPVGLGTLVGGATLGNTSYTGFANCLNTASTGFGKGSYLTSNGLANISITLANTSSGAFTFEAVVQIGFDPTVNNTSACMIMTGESGTTANRIFQWRIVPKGFALATGITATNSPFMTFENIRAGSGSQASIYAAIPTTGPDAIAQGSWYHVAVTYNGAPSTTGNIKMYWTLMDPTRTAADPLTIVSATTTLSGLNPLATVTTPFMIGNTGRSANGNFVGQIDEVRISSQARGPSGMMFQLPSVSLSSLSSQFVPVGTSLNLTSLASGGQPIGYQWQLNGVNINGTTFPNITGITTNSLSISNITSAEAGTYTLVATNANSTNSVSAYIDVGSPVPGLFNTGVAPTGGLQPAGLPDANWFLVQSADTNYSGPEAIVDSSIPSTYVPNGPNSQWIAPGDNVNVAGGIYAYATSFYLDSENTTNMQLTVNWAADNACIDIILNGVDQNLNNGNGFTAFSPNVLTNNFVPGSNNLICIISNAPGSGPNLSGFRAELSALSALQPPTPIQILQAPNNLTVNEYQNAAFAVTAYGDGPLGYQWFSGNTLLPGQTARTLNLTGVLPSQAGTYYVVMSNSLSTNTQSATLIVTVPDTLEWWGYQSADWDLSTTNWLDTTASAQVPFSSNLNVVFDANGSGQPTVSLDLPLAPNSITIDAASYTFAGAGYLTGNFPLMMEGPSALIVDNSGVNKFSGTTTIPGGAELQMGNYDTNGTLGYASVSDNGTLLFTTSGATSFPNAVSGGGLLAMNGTGTELLLGNNSAFTGLVVVSNGTLTPRSGTAFGGSAGVTVLDNAQLFVDVNINLPNIPLTLGGFGLVGNLNGSLHKGGAGATTLNGPVIMTDSGGIGLDGGSSLTFANPSAITTTNQAFAFQLGASASCTVAGSMNLGSGAFTVYGPSTGTATVTFTATNNAWTGGTVLNPNTVMQIGDGGNDGSVGQGSISDSGTLTFDTAASFTETNAISGNGVFNQSGPGRIILMGNPLSGFGGAIHINGNGQLQLAPGDSLNNGSLVIGAAQADTNRLELTGNNNVSLPITIFPRAFTGTIAASPITPPTNYPDILNVSGTNTVIPSSPVIIPSGGNLFCLESDTGYLIFNGGVTANGSGRYFALQGPANGEVDGPLTQNTGYSLNVFALGLGTWSLNGQSSYTGPTIVSNGVLAINGTIASSPVSAYGGTLAGVGTLTGPVTIGAGGALSPTRATGAAIGALTIDNNLTLLAGSVTSLQIDQAASTSDLVTGMTNVILGGTIAVTNLGGTLAAGNSFQLFNAASYSGGFSSITPATPGPGLRWDLAGIAAGGVLRVLSTNPPSAATIATSSLADGMLTLTGGGGTSGDTFALLTSTNVGIPLSKWTIVTTGAYDGSGYFSIAIPAPATGQNYYVVESQ